jgi:hypothetical protein
LHFLTLSVSNSSSKTGGLLAGKSMMMGNNCYRVPYRCYLPFGMVEMSIRHWLETESISKSIIRRISGIVYYAVLLLGFI